jgi:hypothetical protein
MSAIHAAALHGMLYQLRLPRFSRAGLLCERELQQAPYSMLYRGVVRRHHCSIHSCYLPRGAQAMTVCCNTQRHRSLYGLVRRRGVARPHCLLYRSPSACPQFVMRRGISHPGRAESSQSTSGIGRESCAPRRRPSHRPAPPVVGYAPCMARCAAHSRARSRHRAARAISLCGTRHDGLPSGT